MSLKQYSKFDKHLINVKVIYLDQKDWIHLSQAFHNKESKKHKIAKFFLKLSNTSEYIFPISIIHIIETINCLSDNPRRKLIDFMIKVSKGNYVTHYTKFLEMEIYYSLLAIEKGYYHDIRKYVFTKSNLDLMGVYGFSLTDINTNKDASPEIYEKMKKILDDPNHIKILLQKSINRKDKLDIESNNAKILKTIYNEIEEETKFSKGKRVNIAICKFWSQHVIPEVTKMFKKYNISSFTLNKDNILDQMRLVCSQFVIANLLANRKKDTSKNPSSNDIYDIEFLAMAIPYADIVTVDKAYYNYIKQSKLDVVYKTKILKNIDELYELLKK